jgi:hypothetical protein
MQFSQKQNSEGKRPRVRCKHRLEGMRNVKTDHEETGYNVHWIRTAQNRTQQRVLGYTIFDLRVP